MFLASPILLMLNLSGTYLESIKKIIETAWVLQYVDPNEKQTHDNTNNGFIRRWYVAQ